MYEAEIEAQIATTKGQGYRRAVDALARVCQLTTQAGDPERFERLLSAVRVDHRRKRSLMGLLDAKGW